MNLKANYTLSLIFRWKPCFSNLMDTTWVRGGSALKALGSNEKSIVKEKFKVIRLYLFIFFFKKRDRSKFLRNL